MAAAEQLITENLDIWASAVQAKSAAGRGTSSKLELYGIKKLRELILELAVRGLLVPQDPCDEPASELLRAIVAQKEQLVKDGKIKKQKALPAIEEGEIPFELPEGWEWARLGDVGYTQTGGTPKKADAHHYGQFMPFIKPGDIGDGLILSYDNDGLSERGVEALGRVAPEDSVLMVCIGTIGKCARVDRKVTFNQQINSLTPVARIGDYLLRSLQAPYFQSLAWDTSSSTTLSILNKGKWERIPVPLAPASEQSRIVAKVDELMVLCDQLEQQQEANIAAHQTLVKTLLDALTKASEREGFTAAWTRIADHFDTLFTTEWSIDQLKQTVLQLAVMGKLVPQDSGDEPASVLLKKIADEKGRFLNEGKNRKQKLLPPISNDEKPFRLPKNWEWVRLQSITLKITDGDHKTPPRISEGFRLLSAKNVRDGYLDFENCDYISEESYLKSRERCLPEEGDLLIVSVGGTIGRSSIVPFESNFALVRSVALVKPLLVSSEFLKISMDSNLMQDSIHSRKRGGAQPCLYLSEISMFPFSLPPIEEQNRIVAKVNQLLSVCQKMKKDVRRNDVLRLKLADVVSDGVLEQKS